jgi:hypothetical protein
VNTLILLSGLQVLKLVFDVRDAGAGLTGFQVVVTDNQGVGVALMEIFQEPAEGCLLLCRTRVGGLTADVEATLVAHADGVAVVVQTVGTNHPFRSAGLNLSVTTDDVVVADTEFPTSLAMPRIYLSGGRCLVGPYCRTMNDD